MLTTFQLYTWYYLNRDGILTKEEIRQQFFENGNISLLLPTYFLIGKIDEYHAQHNAFVLSISNCRIKVADQLIFCHEDKWFMSKVESIKQNDIDINEAENGEIGFVVKDKVGKGYKVYIKKT